MYPRRIGFIDRHPTRSHGRLTARVTKGSDDARRARAKRSQAHTTHDSTARQPPTTPIMSEKETEFENRNESIRHTIDVLAQYDPGVLNTPGKKAEIIRSHDLDENRVYYVLDKWAHLVTWRRVANSDPLDSDAVRAAYEDETMKQMAGITADGMGDITVTGTFHLDEAFRAIKLLPGDLGMKLFGQILEQSDDIPRDDLVDALRNFTE